MTAYSIDYEVKGKRYSQHIDAKDLQSAKKKLGRKHGYTTGRMINIKNVLVIGYL